MYYQSLPNACFSDACLAVILAGLFCAAIRWMHVCHQYGGQQTDYYFPARRQMTLFFAAIALQFPYVVHPNDAATWVYIQAFGVVYYPLWFSSLLRRYFERHSLVRHRKGVVCVALPLAALCGLGVWSQVDGSTVAAHSAAIRVAAGAIGLVPTVYSMAIGRRLKKKIDKYHYDNFSCEGDFPLAFAKRVVYALPLCLAPMWCILLSDSRWAKFAADIAFTIGLVAFLAVILHPQRTQAALKGAKTGTGTTEEDNAIQREVASIIRRMYRDSSLKKADVIAEMEYGKKTLAKAYLSEIGFYNFVNTYRLEHARLYKEAHPLATLDEIATAAGFRDRFALRYAKKKIRLTDNQFISDFVPEKI